MSKVEYLVADPNAMLQLVREEAKKRFEVERDQILSQVPLRVKRLINEVGFVHQKPAISVSPFSVPPGPFRAMWINKFLELKQQNRLDDLPLLVRFYESQSSYSLVSFHQWISLDKGNSLGFDRPPTNLQDKLILGQDLTCKEEQALLPWREMKLDCRKQPSERHRIGFVECYDLLTFQNLDSDELGVGSRVSIYWEGDDQWYDATIIDCRRGFYHVKYDDPYQEWLPLAERRYKVLSSLPRLHKTLRRVSLEQQDLKRQDEDNLFPKMEPSTLPDATCSRPPSQRGNTNDGFNTQISPETERVFSPLAKKQKFEVYELLAEEVVGPKCSDDEVENDYDSDASEVYI